MAQTGHGAMSELSPRTCTRQWPSDLLACTTHNIISPPRSSPPVHGLLLWWCYRLGGKNAGEWGHAMDGYAKVSFTIFVIGNFAASIRAAGYATPLSTVAPGVSDMCGGSRPLDDQAPEQRARTGVSQLVSNAQRECVSGSASGRSVRNEDACRKHGNFCQDSSRTRINGQRCGKLSTTIGGRRNQRS